MKESEAATPTRDVVERYIALWNEPDADARSRGVAELFTEAGTYTDPLAAAEGHEGFALFDHPDPETAGSRYEVLHMSAPHLGDTGSGRHW